MPAAAHEDVMARFAVQEVLAAHTGNNVVPGVAGQHVAHVVADELVGAVGPPDVLDARERVALGIAAVDPARVVIVATER